MQDKKTFNNNGRLHGPYQSYYTNGSPWYIANYIDGKLRGLEMLYFRKGTIVKQYYAR